MSPKSWATSLSCLDSHPTLSPPLSLGFYHETELVSKVQGTPIKVDSTFVVD